MARTWELAHFGLPHHSCPAGDGWWRGPQPQGADCERALRARGLVLGGSLADGARLYRWNAALADADGNEFDLRQAEERAAWIAARLARARAAWETNPCEPAFMAILNLSPDSFSDGGALPDAAAAGRAAGARAAEGADWLDLGAESTRPGAASVAAEVQLERLLPAIAAVRPAGVPVSVDTRSAAVASACLDAGATMINDVSSLSDPDMAALVADRRCRVVLMHLRGTPEDMQDRTGYRHLVGEVLDEIAARVHLALRAGIAPANIVVDPGLGFAKTAEQTWQLVAALGAFRALGFPVLAGPSRKSFLAAVSGGAPAAERDAATAGAAALCAAEGAAILRLHRGGPAWSAVRAGWAAGVAKRRSRITPSAGSLEVRAVAPAESPLAP